MASTKREFPKQDEPESKKAKLTVSESKQTVKLNLADCDLDFDIVTNGLQGQGLHDQGFSYCWSGARANVGIKGGKYVFGCKIVAAQPVEMEDTLPGQQHVCRVGISRGDDAVGNLGETVHSFGYGGTGKFSSAGEFLNYGQTFGIGDTIVCTVNLESKPLASVGFYKNGKWLGIAKEFDAGRNGLGVVDSPLRERKWESAIFPHVLLKNVVVELQFSAEDGLVLEEGHKAWGCAFEDGNAIMGPVFGNTKDCEILMMVGLPASGKTTWAEKWVKEHPEKRYILLGTNLALDQMKVPGLLRKQNYGERFDRLMDRATGIFNTLLARAAKTPRNCIIDQTNVYKGARKRKLRPFFQYRKIAVVVFPKPDVVKLRAEKRFKEMGKEVPAEAVNEMLANYVLPTSKDMLGSDEFFDQVWFPELNREDSQRYLEEMKRALESASNSPYSSKSSIQSYASPSLQKATIGQRNPNPPTFQAAYDHPITHQVTSSTFPGVGLQGQPQYVHGQYQSGSGPESYGNYGRSPIPGSSTSWNQNYRGVDSYGRPYSESRSSLSAGGIEPYQSHGPSSERSSAYGSNFGCPRTPFSYQSPGDPRSSPLFPRELALNLSSTFGSDSGLARAPSPYSNSGDPQSATRVRTPFPYSSPGGPQSSPHVRTPYPYSNPGDPYYALQVPGQPAYNPRGSSSYGPPYGSPPSTLSYGNAPPTGRQQSEGYFTHPGQRYY